MSSHRHTGPVVWMGNPRSIMRKKKTMGNSISRPPCGHAYCNHGVLSTVGAPPRQQSHWVYTRQLLTF